MGKRCLQMEQSVGDIKSIVENMHKKVDSLRNKADDTKRKEEEALKAVRALKN